MTPANEGKSGSLQSTGTGSHVVIWDGDCGMCSFVKRQVSRLDWLGRFRWQMFHKDVGRPYGVSDEAALTRMHLITSRGTVLPGFKAVRRMLYSLPLTWVIAGLAIAVVPGWWRAVVGAAILLLMSPLVNPAGDALYDWVARNRYRLFPGATCGLKRPG